MADSSPSRLRAGRVVLILGLLLVANSAYIAAFGDPNLFYVANALLHPLLGLAAVVALVAYLFQRNSKLRLTEPGMYFVYLSTGFGVFLAIVGMTRPHTLALYAHVGLAVGGLFFLLGHLGRLGRFAETRARFGRAYRTAAAVALASAAFYVSAAAYYRLRPDPEFQIQNPPLAPLNMDGEGGGPSSLLFPSSATTVDGKPIKSKFFMDSESCQKCHPDIYHQWSSSMHHFASFNNQWYRKSIEYMQDTIGIRSSMWCAGCHDHALAFADLMQKHPIREIEHTREAQNGLGCMSCHSIVHVNDTMGQGGFVMEYPPLDELASSKNPLLHWAHDYAVLLDPKPHRSAFLKDFHRNPRLVPEFCSACHKVHLDVPVNHYRWIRGFDDYDNWQASGVSGFGARSFYYPPKSQTCVDCHMPLVPSKDFANLDGFVHSHRFAAANTAVPTAYGDQEQVEAVEQFLKGALSVDIFALAAEPEGSAAAGGAYGQETPQLESTFAVGEESSTGLAGAPASVGPPSKLIAPLGRVDTSLHRGETVRVEVVVRTRKVGHFFPGGTVDAFDCWLEFQARDEKGRAIFWSGGVADHGRGPVDPGAHFYRSLQLDAHGNPINKRNAWSTRALMYTRLIPPGAADTAHFRLRVPAHVGNRITFTAKLNYRKFSWWHTQWAFAGVRDPRQPHPDVTPNYDDGRWVFAGDLSEVSAKDQRIPDVPIVVIAENSVELPVVNAGADHGPAPTSFAESLKLDPKDRERWNDYGIGLLLQGDLKGAERAFETVAQIDPKYADGWVNVARARVQEGNTDRAKPALAKALELNPRLASAHYFTGLVLKADGNYPAAYDEFAKAEAEYPLDRVVRNQIGRMLFLQRRYREALEQYKHTLQVDPEDLEAHYNLMLCYRGLRDDARAAREEKLYLRFKADEASQAITGPYKLAHPEDNNEAQPIHEHVSVAMEGLQGRPAYGEVRSQESEVRSKRAGARSALAGSREVRRGASSR